MESNELYRVEGLVVGRRRDGKYQYSESGKQALIGLCQQPGTSVSAIAVANGINPNVVRRWLSLSQGERALHGQAPALLPVMLAGEAVAEAEAEPSMLDTRSTTSMRTSPATVEFRIECAMATVRFSAPLSAGTLNLITAGLAKR